MTFVDNSLANILIIQNSNFALVSKYIQENIYVMLGVAFLAALILELLSRNDYKNLVKRLLLAFIIISFSDRLIIGAVNTGMDVGCEIIKCDSNSGKTGGLLQAISLSKIKKTNNKKTSSGFIANTKEVLLDGISSFFWALAYLALLLLRFIYTFVLNLLIALLPLTAIISIVSYTEKSISGSIFTLMTWSLTPVVLALIIALASISLDISIDSEGFFVNTMQQLLQLLLMAIFLLLSPVFAAALIGGSGIHSVGTQLASMGAFAILNTGMMKIANSARFMKGFARSKTGNLTNDGRRKFANFLDNKRQNARPNLDLNLERKRELLPGISNKKLHKESLSNLTPLQIEQGKNLISDINQNRPVVDKYSPKDFENAVLISDSSKHGSSTKIKNFSDYKKVRALSKNDRPSSNPLKASSAKQSGNAFSNRYKSGSFGKSPNNQNKVNSAKTTTYQAKSHINRVNVGTSKNSAIRYTDKLSVSNTKENMKADKVLGKKSESKQRRTLNNEEIAKYTKQLHQHLDN